MSVSLNTAGQIKFRSSGTGTNSYSVTLNCPTAVTADRAISMTDPGADCGIMFDAGNATVAGVKTFSSGIPITATTNQLVLGAAAHLVTISSPAIAAAAQTLTLYDPGASCDVQLGVKKVSATKVAPYQCLLSDSGSIINFSNAAANNITLPLTAASAGFSITVVQASAQANQTVQVICDGARLMGQIQRAGAATVLAQPSTNVNFLTGASQIGDMATFLCNGTSWLVYGVTSNAAGMSFS